MNDSKQVPVQVETRTVFRLHDAPPCPHCGSDVQDLEADNIPPGRWTVATFPRLTYTLRPCGHDVGSFEVSMTSDPVVLEWTAPRTDWPAARKWRQPDPIGMFLRWVGYTLIVFGILAVLGVFS